MVSNWWGGTRDVWRKNELRVRKRTSLGEAKTQLLKEVEKYIERWNDTAPLDADSYAMSECYLEYICAAADPTCAGWEMNKKTKKIDERKEYICRIIPEEHKQAERRMYDIKRIQCHEKSYENIVCHVVRQAMEKIYKYLLESNFGATFPLLQ